MLELERNRMLYLLTQAQLREWAFPYDVDESSIICPRRGKLPDPCKNRDEICIQDFVAGAGLDAYHCLGPALT